MLSKLLISICRQSSLQSSHIRPIALNHYKLNSSRINRYVSSSASTKSSSSSISAKIGRAASFSFYSGLVLAGVGVTGLVIYYFISETLLPTSDVQVFNRAFSIVEKDPQAVQLLGGGRITAYGELTDNKWSRNRPVASRRGYDGHGRQHLLMQFHTKGETAEGLVRLEMVESSKKSVTGIGKFDFRYLVLEVPGHPRLYLIDNSNIQPKKKDPNAGFLGVRWGKGN